MKPLSEGFRVYSRRTPQRELRPPKLSLPRASQPRREATGGRRLPSWLTLSAFAALGAFALFLALLS